MEHPDVSVYNDKLVSIYYNEIVEKQSQLSCHDLARELETQLEDALSSGRTVIFKDMAWSIQIFCVDLLRRWKTKFNIKFIYLIRHPLAQFASLERAVAMERLLQRFSDETLDDLASMKCYEPIWNMYSLFGGKIIIAEDLQSDPAAVIRDAYGYAGLEFQERYLKYESLSTKGIPDDWVFWQHWYVDCFNATSIRKGVTDIASIQINNPEDKAGIEESLVFYNLFLAIKDS